MTREGGGEARPGRSGYDPHAMSARRITLGIVLYGAMTLAGLALSWWRDEPLVSRAGALPIEHVSPVVASLGLGLALALATTVSTRWLVARGGWARTLRAQMRPFLAGATSTQLSFLAVLSGVAEEVFFRGALQPWLGLLATSLAFGLLHVGPTRAFLPWTLWAIVMGALFGLIVHATGELAGAIVAHVAINAVNLRLVAQYDGALDAPATRAPALVGRRRLASAEHAAARETPRRVRISA